MDTFKINVEYLYVKTITVEAESMEQAYNMVDEMVQSNDVVMDDLEDFLQYEIFPEDE